MEDFAARHGYRVRRIVFEHPDDASPMVAELYRWWYRQCGIGSDRLLVESFVHQQPYSVLRHGLIPYWSVFSVKPSVERLEHYRALCKSLGNSQGLAFLDLQSLDPIPDWGRISLGNGMSVEEGHRFAASMVDGEMNEANDVWSLLHGERLASERLVEALNAPSQRVVARQHASRSGRSIRGAACVAPTAAGTAPPRRPPTLWGLRSVRDRPRDPESDVIARLVRKVRGIATVRGSRRGPLVRKRSAAPRSSDIIRHAHPRDIFGVFPDGAVGRVRPAAVEGPLPDIPEHIEQSPLVRQQLRHWERT